MAFLKEILDFMTKDVSLVSNQMVCSTEALSAKILSGQTQILDSFDVTIPLEEKILSLFGKDITNYGSLPTLSWAVQHKLSTKTIKMLLESRPEYCLLRDELGNSPLHIAIINHAPSDLVSTLIRNQPYSLLVQNGEKKNSIHLAVECNSEIDVLEVLIEADENNAGITARDKNGCTPIHLAIKNGLNSKSLSILLRHCPRVVLVKDYEDRTAFKLAIKYKSDEAVIQTLLHSFQLASPIHKEYPQRCNRKRVHFAHDEKVCYFTCTS
jgi:ankyrin repeat protein